MTQSQMSHTVTNSGDTQQCRSLIWKAWISSVATQPPRKGHQGPFTATSSSVSWLPGSQQMPLAACMATLLFLRSRLDRVRLCENERFLIFFFPSTSQRALSRLEGGFNYQRLCRRCWETKELHQSKERRLVFTVFWTQCSTWVFNLICLN